MEIIDRDFPLLVGACGLRKQLQCLRSLIENTFAEEMSDRELITCLRLRRKNKSVEYDPHYLQLPSRAIETIPLYFVHKDYRTRLIFRAQPHFLDIDEKNNTRVYIYASAYNRASKLRLAFINNIFRCDIGCINTPFGTWEISERKLKILYRKCMHNKHTRRIMYFLYLVNSCSDW